MSKPIQELPRNESAERALLGSVLLRGHVDGTPPKPEDFSDKLYRDLWRVMLQMSDQDKPIDIVTMWGAVAGKGLLDETEAQVLFTQLIGECPSSMHYEQYCSDVSLAAAKRKLALALTPISKIAYGNGRYEPWAVFAEAQAELERAADGMPITDREQWTAAELAALEPSPEPWILEGLIVEEGVTLYAGDYGAGKTISTLDLCLAVASGGGPAWNSRAAGGKVIYFGADNSREDLTINLRALAAGRGMRVPHDTFVVDMSPLSLGEPGGFTIIESMLKEEPVKLAVLDTLGIYLGNVDLNDYAQMYQIFMRLRAMANKYGTGFLLLHHLTKDQPGKTRRRLLDRAMGSGALVGASNSYFALTAHGTGEAIERTIVHAKARRGRQADPIKFVMVPGREGGMSLAFDLGDEAVATETLAETVKSFMLDLLRRNPESVYTTEDLTIELEAAGMDVSERTLKRGFGELKDHPLVVVARSGRKNVYRYGEEIA